MYVKIFASILKSSVWDESPTTRIVWLTFLLEADENGFVKGVEKGLARIANVSVEDFRAAVHILESDDIDSQDQSYGGRRVEKVEGGWIVLNYTKYREIRTREQVKAADKKRTQRARQRETSPANGSAGKQLEGASNADAAAVPGHVPNVPTIASASASGSEGRGAGEGSEPEQPRVESRPRAYSEAPWMAGWSEAHHAAYASIRAKHRDPAALDELIADVHAAGYTGVVLGQALVELRRAGAPISTATLTPFAKRVVPVAAPRALAIGAAAMPSAAPWCVHCGDGVREEREGSRRLQQVHAPGCLLRVDVALPARQGVA